VQHSTRRLPAQIEVENVNDPRKIVAENSVRVELLSGRVVVDGCGTLLSDLQQGLVCALARCRHPISREQLEAMMWPEVPGEQARNLLAVALHRLRRRLGERFIVASAEGYRLGDHVVVDLWEIEAMSRDAQQMRTDRATAQRWLAIYRPIACGCKHQLGKYEFVRALEHRLSCAARTVTERLAAETLRHGDAALALELVQLALAADACDEAAREIAIRCQLALGNRAAAIREYLQYARALAEELELEPCFTLRSLIEPCVVAAGNG
jgi:DNA-binding SARP family transcriptional activator